ncbi:FtsX-like permease family protein [Microbacterium sp. SA39]|uniref:FtsX-like permease family protein n=1 Tax=Microbacterium sp. SA39 TaxID=1263625 RepID=UPI0005FA50BD|nr:ABC transporter permease [Microbacterium sp. SA39]KJQ52721.1 FtsX-like permease family protein [Microbacterium sp. SA39]
MWSFARAAIRAHRSSFVGSFLIVLFAAALLSANGVLMETGIRVDAPLLVTVAGSFAGTAILVVVLVDASTFSSALRQRSAEFALLRAVGATPAQVRSMVNAEVVLVFAVAAPLGAIPGLFAASLLMPVLVSGGIVPAGTALTLSPLPLVGALLLLFPTALLAARLAARRITRVSATAAVRGSGAESSQLSLARRITAASLFLAGIVIAGTPFFVPGTLGSATGATSAFLLISAAALAGPALIGGIARRAARATRSSSNAPGMLALVNTRGFSRRLTTAIIPLALFLSLGTVQTGVNGSLVDAAGMQLRDGLGSDLIITSPDGVSPEQEASVAAAPGIDAVVASSTVVAEVNVDSEDLEGLPWEQAGIRTIDGSTTGMIDVGVTAGSLDDLTGEATIAVSSDFLIGTGMTVGDTAGLRYAGSPETTATIVAVYDRGLAFGDFVIDESAVPEAVRPTAAEVLFARGSADLTSLGLQTVSVDDYVEAAVTGAASQQQLSAILLFVLLFFVAIAAANTLGMITGARRPEFALLRRVGATRSQLTSMVAIESLFVTVTALVIGTLSVLPALIGVAYGMLGSITPAIDWPVYAALAAVIVIIATTAMVVPARSRMPR